MAECLDRPDAPDDPYLADLAAAAAILDYPLPRERDEAVCTALAEAADGLLSRLARGRGAVDVSVGDLLDALSVGDRLLQLGFASLGDYSRERLGLPGSTAVKMARFARQLRDRPFLRAAVWAGSVTVRAAQAVLPLAVGEHELEWVIQSQHKTVRALDAEVRGKGGRSESEDLIESWERICISLPDDARPIVDEALAMFDWLLGPDTPKAVRVERICDEFLCAHPLSPEEAASVSLPAASVTGDLEAIKVELEEQTASWAFLSQPAPVAATRACDREETDPWALDAALQQLMARRKGWDEAFGHLALIFRQLQGHLRLDFASFGHYCEERLGMAEQTVQQRASLERRLHQLPPLRAAMRAGTVSYEKARLIARVSDPGSVQGWIDRAQAMTCVQLRRATEAEADTQMCARGELEFLAPARVRGILAQTFRAARKLAGGAISPGECLTIACGHFADTWRPAAPVIKSARDRVMQRDGGRCQVPVCSHPAADSHHIQYRSRGGSDDPENQVALCKAHHLHGIHLGYLRVRGKAPDGLYWELGLRRDQLSLLAFPPRATRAAPAPDGLRPGREPERGRAPVPTLPRAAPDRTAARTATT